MTPAKPPPPDRAPMLTVRDVAARLNVSEKTVGRLARQKVIASCLIGNVRRFKPSDVDRFVDRLIT